MVVVNIEGEIITQDDDTHDAYDMSHTGDNEKNSFPREALNAARNTALNLLSQREHSQFELQQKLSLRNYSTDIIESVVTRLLKENLLSDARYSESYARMRANKGYGPLRIRQELYERGVAKEIVGEMLSENETDWLDILQRTHDKKFKPSQPDSTAERAKRIRFLQQRGFGLDLINQVFKKFV